MKYYIILLLAIALTGCKKEETDYEDMQKQAVANMQGVRMYRGYVADIDTQWLEDYPIEIYQQYANSITLRSLDSTRPSLSTLYGLGPEATPPAGCNACVRFDADIEYKYYTTVFRITYNLLTNKVTRVHVVFEQKYPGSPSVNKRVFELAEQ